MKYFDDDNFSEADDLPSEQEIENASRRIERSNPHNSDRYGGEYEDVSEDGGQDEGFPISAEEASLEDQGESEDAMEDVQILSDARLRLEQGRLYEILMTHNIFEGVQADQRAIKNVEREIKNFIKERLEIMLGIKSEKPKQVEIGLDPEEIQILKGLVSKAKGSVLGKVQPTEARPATVAAPVRSNKPNPIKAPQPAQNVRVTPKRAKEAPPAEELPSKKSVFEMNEDELLERSKRIHARQARLKARADGGIPMPNAAQEAMSYQTQQALSSNQNGGLGSTIFNILQRNGSI